MKVTPGMHGPNYRLPDLPDARSPDRLFSGRTKPLRVPLKASKNSMTQNRLNPLRGSLFHKTKAGLSEAHGR